MIFVFSEESTMGTKCLPVSQTYDLELLVMHLAELDLLECRRKRWSLTFRWLFGGRTHGWLLSFLDNFVERHVFRKVLQICFLKILLMSTVKTDEGSNLISRDNLLKTRSASTVLARRHHSGLAGAGKVLITNTALQILSVHFFFILYYWYFSKFKHIILIIAIPIRLYC